MDPLLSTIIATSGASFLNFVATKIYNRMTGSSKNFIWKEKSKNLQKLKSPIDFEELKKRARIVVIDDEESFPTKIFKSEGYAIDKWDKVTDVSYGKLESGSYDIIILDIKGVASDISQDDGIGVLHSLKKRNPAQIIIAFSQYSYDLSKTKFFELADETIAKPSDFLKIKEIIDNLISTKFNPIRYIDTLHTLLEDQNIKKRYIKKVDSDLIRLVQKKEQPDWNKIFDFAKDKTDLIKQVITISNTILKFFQ